MADNYVVVAPLVIGKNPDRSDVYLYTGAIVPEGQDPTWVEQMLTEGLIAAAPSDEKKSSARAAVKE